jgi:hypothetical protein
LEIYIANTKLRVKERFFSERSEFNVDLKQLVLTIIRELNLEPEAYDANLADALKLARKIGFTVDTKSIPSKQPIVRKPIQGPFGVGNRIEGICVNCEQAGIFDIADACRLAKALGGVHSLA